MTIQNPKLDIETLSLFKKKIEINEASPEDYKTLDFFLTSFGVNNFILNQFNEYNIHSYDEFILERKKRFGERNRIVDGILLGKIMGAISALDKYITNRL